MPRYFFHIDDGHLDIDDTGTVLGQERDARAEAVTAAGAVLAQLDGSFWEHGTPWVMHVTDEQSQLLFSLHFHAEVPAGPVKYQPLIEDQQPTS